MLIQNFAAASPSGNPSVVTGLARDSHCGDIVALERKLC
jgi:hypothetical protein